MSTPVHEKLQPAQWCAPDYGQAGLFNLIGNVRASFTGEAVPGLRIDDVELLEQLGDNHIVLLLIDGLGSALLQNSRTSVLKSLPQTELSSVFPSTTASAVTTVLTGLSPAQHGNVGWFMYHKPLDRIIAPLPFATRPAYTPLAGEDVTPESVFGYGSIFDGLDCPGFSISPQAIAFSVYNRYHCGDASIRPYTTLADMFDKAVNMLRRSKSRTFLYLYYPEVDRLAHEHGPYSRQVEACIEDLDDRLNSFLAKIAGLRATLLITADHGFMECTAERRILLNEHPGITELLTQPLGGEPRVAYCQVRENSHDAFEQRVDEELCNHVTAVKSQELLDAGWFGPGPRHHQIKSRIGDYALLPADGYVIHDSIGTEPVPELRGVHGGLSPAEMKIPLCVVAD